MLNILYYSKKILLIVSVLISFNNSFYAQKRVTDISDTTYLSDFIHLTVDEEFLSPAKLAFEHYPELDSVTIIFKYKAMPWMMAARPSPGFIFRSKENRTYFILVNTNKKMNADTLFSIMPYKAKVGIIGHEMAHILDYEEMSRMALFFFGIKYIICTKKVEKETDLTTIMHGLGEDLIAYNNFIQQNTLVSEKYLRKRARNYMSMENLRKNNRKLKNK